MAKVKVKMTFPRQLIDKPIIYCLGKDYNIITNIRRANVREGTGWVVLELEGKEEDINAGIKDLEAKGIRVDPADGEVLE